MGQLKFLMIRRKHTLGYIEFLRGRYDVNNIIHGSEIDPNLIKVEQVYKSILSYT